MDFTKMQGAANDFVLIETSGRNNDWPRLAIAMCDRHRGIGADSLLLMVPSDKADFGMLTFDADGSEAETCGNGIRCLAKYINDKGLVGPDVSEITIETAAGINRIKLDKRDGRLVKIRVNMGKPRFSAAQIPIDEKPETGELVNIKQMLCYKINVAGLDMELNCVSMGNPHAVYFVETPVSEFPLASLGPAVEKLAAFPHRANFEVVRVLGPTQLEARVWERGVGETLACGSGACAITVASNVRGFTKNKVAIDLPGGTLDAEWNGDGEVVLSGPAEYVYEGKWPD